MFNAFSLDLIRGFGLGIQYMDGWEDEEGEFFVVIVEFVIFRFLFFWEKE